MIRTCALATSLYFAVAVSAQTTGGATQGAGSPPVGSIPQTPWFSNPQVQSQLNFNPQVQRQMQMAYQEAWTRYNQGLRDIPTNFDAAQRQQRMNELGNTFNSTFNESTSKVFSDPTERQRFDQMNLQYRNWDAFSDPTVQQQLKLTPEQQQQIGKFRTRWNEQWLDMQNSFRTDPKTGEARFNDMRTQYQNQLNSVLSKDQQSTWRQMTGEPFQFSPTYYMPPITSK